MIRCFLVFFLLFFVRNDGIKNPSEWIVYCWFDCENLSISGLVWHEKAATQRTKSAACTTFHSIECAWCEKGSQINARCDVCSHSLAFDFYLWSNKIWKHRRRRCRRQCTMAWQGTKGMWDGIMLAANESNRERGKENKCVKERRVVRVLCVRATMV